MKFEKERCSRDFLYFCETVLGYKDLKADIHKEIASNLQTDFSKGVIMIPRGNLKTCEISIAWPIWCWIQNPNLRFGIGSATDKLAVDICTTVQQHVSENPKFVELFGNWKSEPWNQYSFNIKPKTKVTRDTSLTAFSVNSTVTGKHFDIIILDDIATEQNSRSDILRQRQIELYKECLNLVVSDETKGRILLVGTRWHFGDVYNYVLTKAKRSLDFVIDEPGLVNEELQKKDPERWRSRIKELLCDPKTKILFPQKFNKEIYRTNYEINGTFKFSCQIMNYPVSDETSAFKVEDLQFVNTYPADLIKYMLIDPAGIESSYKKSDDWAILVVGVNILNEIYILDAFANNKMSVNEVLNVIQTMDGIYGVSAIALEKDVTSANLHILRSQYPSVYRKVKVINLDTQRSKKTKILSLQPYTENKRLFIVEDTNPKYETPLNGKIYKLNPGKVKLINQMIDYPNTEHDDCIDALASILEVIQPVRKVRYGSKPYEWKPRDSKTGY